MVWQTLQSLGELWHCYSLCELSHIHTLILLQTSTNDQSISNSLFFRSDSLLVELSSCLIGAIALSVPSPFNCKAIKFPTVCSICVQNESSYHIAFFFFFFAFTTCLAKCRLIFLCPHGAGSFCINCSFSNLYPLVGRGFLASLHGKLK